MGVADLAAIEAKVESAVQAAIPATVAVRVGRSQGSGVIVSADGLVLTAGHVVGKGGQQAAVILSDGREVAAETLGRNHEADSGMLRISIEGPWPFVEVAQANPVAGDWCISLGHPGGYQKGRTPVVRSGRVVFAAERVVRSDCTLIGGDSGGPLIDMQGRVIGIHSRIGGPATANFHVAMESYLETWDRLAAGEVWGEAARRAYLGIQGQETDRGFELSEVTPNSAADRAGLKVGDVIESIDGDDVRTFEDVSRRIADREVGEEVRLIVRRGGETYEVVAVLGRRR
jgi:serine protease Do